MHTLDDRRTQQNLKQQEVLADYATEGNLEGMRELIADGAQKVCVSHFKDLIPDLLNLILAKRVHLGQGFVDIKELMRGREAACIEINPLFCRRAGDFFFFFFLRME